MANDVFANGREISCKSGSGKSIAAFPDVCFTPPENPATPPGVPIPYPNTGMTTDTTSGSKTVKISGNEVMLKDQSFFKRSSGDEAGCAAKKGVLTSVNMGKVYFTAWSMDVKIEGQNAVRHLDLTTHNHASKPGNTPPWPYADSGATSDTTPPKTGNLKVKVVNICTGDPVPDAKVTVKKLEKKTSASGQAEFPDLLAGAYTAYAEKRYEDCDYITFVIHYPRISVSNTAKSHASETATVTEGGTANADIKIVVYRLVPNLIFHRRHIDFGGEDKYGHWWTEVTSGESYGWWPKYPIGSPRNRASAPPTPPATPPASAGRLQQIQHMFSMAVFKVKSFFDGISESGLVQTFRGVDGELNGQTSFGGTPTRDPHELGGDSGNEKYQPVVYDCRTDEEIRDCMRGFATSYTGSWSWRLELGNHCHTFQKGMMSHCRAAEVKQL